MKTKLLFILLLASQLMSAQYYISEIVPSPPNSSSLFNDLTDTPLVVDYEYAVDDCLEYFEFRGPANAAIPDDVYFIAIDGDDDTPGRVQDAIELGGLTFGSNGILVIVANMTFDTGSLDSDGSTDISGVKITNPYAAALAASDANVVTVELTGTPAWVDEGSGHFELDKFNSVSKSPDIDYDGTINDQSSTYMIVQTTAGEGNPDGEEIDTNADGVLDGLATGWTIYDSVSILDDDDSTEYAYSEVIFIEEPDVALPVAVTLTYDAALSPSIVLLNQYPNYVARQGLSTGYAATIDGTNNDDWIAGRVNSRSYPDWKFSSTGTRNFPTAQLTGNNLSDFSGLTIGEVNVDFNNPALSTEDFSASDFKVYPNPASDYINIESKSVKVSSVDMYNVLGAKVLSSELTEDRVNVSSLVKGVYFMKINAEDGSLTKKVVID